MRNLLMQMLYIMHIIAVVDSRPSVTVITSAKEDMTSSLFVCLSVCLSVINFAQKLPNGFAWNFQGMLAICH